VAIGGDEDSTNNKIMWDAASKTATILYNASAGQKIIQFTAGSYKMVVDGVTIPINNGAIAEIKDGRMYVPFRALGEAMGVDVSWDNSARTAIFNT
jgi:N-acetylmuramoyl-L-alanine amidase